MIEKDRFLGKSGLRGWGGVMKMTALSLGMAVPVLTGAGAWAAGNPYGSPFCSDSEPTASGPNRGLSIDLADVSPLQGGTEGETEVTLSGSGFTRDTKVFVGQAECRDVRFTVPGQVLTCTPLPHPPGVVDVVVKNPGGGCAKLDRAFFYVQSLAFSRRTYFVEIGKKLELRVKGGKPPYQFELLSGEGSVEALSLPVPSASPSPGANAEASYLPMDSVGPERDADPLPPVPGSGGSPGEAKVTAEDEKLLDEVTGSASPEPNGEADLFEDTAPPAANANFRPAALLSAPFSPTTGVIQVRDANGKTAETTFFAYFPLQIQPSMRELFEGEFFTVSPTGGVPPYRFELGSGKAKVDPITGFFTGFEEEGDVVAKVTDSEGNQAQVAVHVKVDPIPTTPIVAGSDHTCAIFSGDVKCWGGNTHGQLGRRIPKWSSKPLPVKGLPKEIVSLSAGLFHTCAMSAQGAAFCWGDNRFGQVGDGTSRVRQHKPVPVAGLSRGVRALSSSAFHSCAIVYGNLACWGRNNGGQLGNKSSQSTATPYFAQHLNRRVSRVAAGSGHTCVQEAGWVKCWGKNYTGQLGRPLSVSSVLPKEVEGLEEGATRLVGGRAHSCAILGGGAVKCWGFNGIGNLGQNSNRNQYKPQEVHALSSGATELSASDYHTCAVANQSVYCWGYNYKSQLGDGSTVDHWTPVQVQGLNAPIQNVAAGSDHTCALATDGRILCWGDNRVGQLGMSGVPLSKSPVEVRIPQ